MTVDTAAIRALAEAATQGPWHHVPRPLAVLDGVNRVRAEGGRAIYEGTSYHDAAFIAATDPDAVLAMCDELDRLREAERICTGALGLVAGAHYRDEWSLALRRLLAERDEARAERAVSGSAQEALGAQVKSMSERGRAQEATSERLLRRCENMGAELEVLNWKIGRLRAERAAAIARADEAEALWAAAMAALEGSGR